MMSKIFGLGFAHLQNDNLKYFKDLIHTGLDNGITYFEACSFYTNAKCEQNLSTSIFSFVERDKILLGDKLSNQWCKMNFDGNLELYFEDQLKKCNTTYFDYYLIQYVDEKYFDDNKMPNYLFIQQYNFLQQKKAEGKIKNIGFAFHYYPEYFEECFKNFNWDFVQFSLNYYKWKFGYAKDLYKTTLKYNIPIIAMEPLAMGLLSQPSQIKTAAYNFLMTLKNIKIILNGSVNIDHLFYNLKDLNAYYNFNQCDKELLDKFLQNRYICSCKECSINCPKNYNLKELILNFNKKSELNENKKNYYNYFEPFIKIKDFCKNCNLCQQNCENNIDFEYLIWKEIFPLRI